MPNTPRGPRPDPMAREVDRLLANLSHASLTSRPEAGPPDSAPAGTPAPNPGTRRRPARTARARNAPTRADAIALWGRLLLGVSLGVAMTQWPYTHGCGAPLFGYMGAVAVVLLAGGWIAAVSWERRNGVVHILALVLVLWGIALTAERVLPRVGYAAEHAVWGCPAR